MGELSPGTKFLKRRLEETRRERNRAVDALRRLLNPNLGWLARKRVREHAQKVIQEIQEAEDARNANVDRFLEWIKEDVEEG